MSSESEKGAKADWLKIPKAAGVAFRDAARVLYEAARHFSNAKGPNLSAALAYFFMLSSVPMAMLIFAVAVWLVGDSSESVQALTELIDRIAPGQLAKGLIDIVGNARGHGIAGLAGGLTLYITGTSALHSFEAGVHTLLGVQQRRNIVISRMMSAGFIMVGGLALMFSASITTVLGVVIGAGKQFVPIAFHDFIFDTAAINAAMSFGFAVLAYMVLVKAFAGRHLARRAVVTGALSWAFLWELTKWVLTAYVISAARIRSLYGSLGAAFVVMIWVYIVAFTFYFALSISLVIQRRRDSSTLGATTTGSGGRRRRKSATVSTGSRTMR